MMLFKYEIALIQSFQQFQVVIRLITSSMIIKRFKVYRCELNMNGILKLSFFKI